MVSTNHRALLFISGVLSTQSQSDSSTYLLTRTVTLFTKDMIADSNGPWCGGELGADCEVHL